MDSITERIQVDLNRIDAAEQMLREAAVEKRDANRRLIETLITAGLVEFLTANLPALRNQLRKQGKV